MCERGDVSDYFSSPFAEREGSVTLLNAEKVVLKQHSFI